MLFDIDTELILYRFAHGPDIANCFTELVAESVCMASKRDDVVGRVGHPQIFCRTAHHGCQRASHCGHGAHWPKLVKDERHDDESEEYPDETVANRGEVDG